MITQRVQPNSQSIQCLGCFCVVQMTLRQFNAYIHSVASMSETNPRPRMLCTARNFPVESKAQCGGHDRRQSKFCKQPVMPACVGLDSSP